MKITSIIKAAESKGLIVNSKNGEYNIKLREGFDKARSKSGYIRLYFTDVCGNAEAVFTRFDAPGYLKNKLNSFKDVKQAMLNK